MEITYGPDGIARPSTERFDYVKMTNRHTGEIREWRNAEVAGVCVDAVPTYWIDGELFVYPPWAIYIKTARIDAS